MVSSTPRPHFTPGKDPVPILQEAGWAPGTVSTGGKSRRHRDSIPDRPVRSQSLYRRSYPVHNNNNNYNIIIVLLAQYCSGDKIEKNEMGGACSAYGGEERFVQGFGREI